MLLELLSEDWGVIVLDIEHLEHDGGVATSHDFHPPEGVGSICISHDWAAIAITLPPGRD